MAVYKSSWAQGWTDKAFKGPYKSLMLKALLRALRGFLKSLYVHPWPVSQTGYSYRAIYIYGLRTPPTRTGKSTNYYTNMGPASKPSKSFQRFFNGLLKACKSKGLNAFEWFLTAPQKPSEGL